MARARQQSRNRGIKPGKAALIASFALALTFASAAISPIGKSQAYESDSTRIDQLFAPIFVWKSMPWVRPGFFRGAIRNLAAAADRAKELQAVDLAKIRDREARFGHGHEAKHPGGKSPGGGGGISSPNLTLSRYSGFTQNETSTAWCGSGVVVGFNDTAAEITTMAAGQGVSGIGFSASSNNGVTFKYVGAPTTTASFSQVLSGDPVVACADASTFYYSAIWLDGLNTVNGVAIGKSVDGGMSFMAPVAAITKLNSGHIIGEDWLAIKSASPQLMYIAYVDSDFSGSVCGIDMFAQPILRAAVEMVNSADGGASWSVPTVVEEVCANSGSPNANVATPRVAVDSAGVVYVAWEAIGENGGAATSRQIKIARSTDGGNSFSTPVQIASASPLGNGADLQGFIRASESPSLAIGKGSKNAGVVYVTWSQASATLPDQLASTGSYGFADVEFSQSTDGGSTWSTPVRVNNNAENSTTPSDQFDPAIGTDKNGKIVVCFYDRRRSSNNFTLDRYCGTSTKGGASWLNTKVTLDSFAPDVGQDALLASDYMGLYDTVVSDTLDLRPGLMAPYASTGAGNPTVMFKKF